MKARLITNCWKPDSWQQQTAFTLQVSFRTTLKSCCKQLQATHILISVQNDLVHYNKFHCLSNQLHKISTLFQILWKSFYWVRRGVNGHLTDRQAGRQCIRKPAMNGRTIAEYYKQQNQSCTSVRQQCHRWQTDRCKNSIPATWSIPYFAISRNAKSGSCSST